MESRLAKARISVVEEHIGIVGKSSASWDLKLAATPDPHGLEACRCESPASPGVVHGVGA